MKNIILIFVFLLIAFGGFSQTFDSLDYKNGSYVIIEPAKVKVETPIDTLAFKEKIQNIKRHIADCKRERDVWIAKIEKAQNRLNAYQKLKP